MRKQKQIDQLFKETKRLREDLAAAKDDLERHLNPGRSWLDFHAHQRLRHLERREFEGLEAKVVQQARDVWDLKARVDKMDPPKPIPRFEIVKTEDGTWNLIEITDKHQKLIGVYDTKADAKKRVSEIVAFRQNPHKDNEVIVP